MPSLDTAAAAALMDDLTKIAAAAAEAILALEPAAEPRRKADGSPVTAADEAAQAIICDRLGRLAPGLPVISEELAAGQRPRPLAHGSYFLVDPLDGTQEFIAGRDEYSVNIALMTDGAPVLGIICAPALGLFWRGIVGRGADRMSLRNPSGETGPIQTRRRPAEGLAVMVSRSHLEARTEAYIATLPGATLLRCGSSIKFCRLAEGAADLYPRLAPTHDWDVAAGHAILAAAGGSISNSDGGAIVYGTPDLLIPAFIAHGASPEVRG